MRTSSDFHLNGSSGKLRHYKGFLNTNNRGQPILSTTPGIHFTFYDYYQRLFSDFAAYRATIRYAARMPSQAAEVIPPAYPAPSPVG